MNGYGTYALTTDGVWTYNLDNTNSAVQALNDGESLTDTFTVQTIDGTSQIVSVTINGANDVVVDTTPPTVDITSTKTTFKAGETAEVTFTFSEAPVDFSISDISVTGGTLTTLAVNPANPQVYTATFTPTATNSLNGSIAIAAGTFTDTAGNNNLLSNTLGISGDTLAPTAPNITSISDDTGVSNSDRITKDKTLTLSGTAEANSTVQLLLDNNVIGTASTNVSGNWSFNYTGTPLADSIYPFIATATDSAGNASTTSTPFVVTVDTIAAIPVLSLANDSGSSNSDRITNSGVVNIIGLETGASWQYSTNNGGTWINGTGTSFTLTGNGTKNVIARQTDLAGNTSSNSALFTFTLDTSAPSKTATVTSLTPDTGISATDFITNDGTTSRTYSGTLSSALAIGESLQVSVNGTTWAEASVSNTTWIFNDATAQSSNWTIQTRVVDVAGNAGTIRNKIVTLDQQISDPNLVSLDLAATSDTGASSTDNLTNIEKPRFTVTFDRTKAKTGDILEIRQGSTLLGATTINSTQASSGSANVILTVGLAQGVNTLSAVHRDAAGNSVTGTSTLNVTYDNQISAASALTLDLLATSDSGSSSTDNITNIILPTVAISFDNTKAQAGDTLQIRKGSTVLGTVTLDAAQANAGIANITLSTALTSGVNTLSGVHRDAAGNIVTGTNALAVTLDNTRPATARVTGYTSTSINGISEPNARVLLSTSASSPSSFVSTATADGTGKFTIDLSGLSGSFSGTSYSLFTQDVAGNLSAASGIEKVIVGTSGVDILTGVGGAKSDLLIGNGSTDIAQYLVSGNAISLTGQVSSVSGSINIGTANIDVLTEIETIQFTNTGYSGVGTGSNQLRSTILNSSLANNSVSALSGNYDVTSGVFTLGSTTPNATLLAFDSNAGTGTNYEGFLLLDKPSIAGSLSASSGIVTIGGI